MKFVFLIFFIISIVYSVRVHNKNKHKLKSKHGMRNKLTLREYLRDRDFPIGALGKRLKAMLASDPTLSAPTSSQVRQSQRATDFEDMEKQAFLAPFWYADICSKAPEGGNIELKCSDIDQLGQNCFGGQIDEVYTAYFGVVSGECPDYYHTWKCVKEIHGTIQDDEQGKYQCKDQPSCVFKVDPTEYKDTPWTTWNVDGPMSPVLNHYPNLNECDKNPFQQLAIVASCKCSNPIESPSDEKPPLLGEFAAMAQESH